ncbi:MAG: bifunctional transcriptional activator/DNA repair enzyme AdaA [Chromatocurvus sp.]
MPASTQYRRIAMAINFLQQHHREQPSLSEIAAAAHLSPTHFQRVFTAWAGVSPKKFLQYLTLEHARSLLAENATVEEAATASGLSGAGRLHDLFISIDGMTPGEFRRGGATLQIKTAVHETQFGEILMASTGRGICGLSFVDNDRHLLIETLEHRFPHAAFTQGTDAHQRAALSCFGGSGQAGSPVRLHLQGSPFQLKVWESLLRIPPGRLATYAQIAEAIGRSGAARAVGTAIGSNPVAVLIPCHRVIRASGALGGYRWGLPRKAALIGWESAQRA